MIFGGSCNGAQATDGSRYLFVDAHNPGTAYVQQVNFRAFNLSGSGEADSFGVWISDYSDRVKNTKIQFSYDGNTWDTAVTSTFDGQVFFMGFNSDKPFSHVRIVQEIDGTLGFDQQDGFGIDEVYVGRTTNFQPSVPEPATLAI